MIFKSDIFFHEDDYCQRELVPIQNLLSKRNEVKVAEQNSNMTRTEDGFTSMFIVSETKYPLKNIKINVVDFETILKKHALFYFELVYTGYATYRELKINTKAFGFENYVFYYEFDNGIVTHAWITYNLFSNSLDYPDKLQSTLHELGITYDLILIDWNELITVLLKNEPAITNYFNLCRGDD